MYVHRFESLKILKIYIIHYKNLGPMSAVGQFKLMFFKA